MTKIFATVMAATMAMHENCDGCLHEIRGFEGYCDESGNYWTVVPIGSVFAVARLVVGELNLTFLQE